MFLVKSLIFVVLVHSIIGLNLNSIDLEKLEKQSYQNVRDYFNQQRNAPGPLDPLNFLTDEAKLLIPHIKERFIGTKKTIPRAFDSLTCSTCIGTIGGLLDLMDLGLLTEGVIYDTAIPICRVVLDKEVCEGALNNYLPEIWYIIHEKREQLSGARICAIVLGGKCGAWEEISQWEVQIPDNKPEPVVPTLPAEGSPKTKILHLTDIHLDLRYKVGTVLDCGKPHCCTDDTEMAPLPTLAAGYWGGYNCDVPVWTFEDMLNHIRETHLDEIEYIMMTGDNPPHDVWLQSREGNLAHTRKVVELIHKVFPDKQVVVTLGNHESFPCNSFPPVDLAASEFNPTWFYESMADIFSPWLPSDSFETIQRYGYYSFLLREGFRIIVVNSNMCLTYNFWTMYQWEDLNGQLAWLVEELSAAEANNELVHIVSHVPPGNHDCLGAWGREYSKIVDRFENTIMAQFYGHTHNDEFIVFYDTETNSRPTNIGHVTPSVTTYTGYNHGYRLYTFDGFYPGNSLRILDTETYIFNLATANLHGEEQRPQYFQFYQGTVGLEVDALFPENYDQIARRMANDEIFYQKYLRYFNKGGEGDQHDRREVTCSMVTTSYIDDRKCIEIMGN